jgi:thiol-disulfide isomerase/thioredoxin
VPTLPDNLSLRTLEDELIYARDLKGRPTLITFWATWCAPCRAELPIKLRLFREFGDRIHVVGVNLIRSEASVADVRAFTERHGLPYTIGLDDHNRWSSAFLVRGTPTTVVLDADAAVRGRWFGPVSYDRVATVLNALLPVTGDTAR